MSTSILAALGGASEIPVYHNLSRTFIVLVVIPIINNYISLSSDPALCLEFIILLCSGRFWALTFGQWCVAPSQ